MDTTFVMDGLKYHLDMKLDKEVTVRFDTTITIPINLEGVTVNVPIDYDDTVAIDLSKVVVESPIVVVKGSATGNANTGKYKKEFDPETGDSIVVLNPDTGLPEYETVLVVPVKDDAGNIVGNAEIDLNDVNITADVNASGTAGQIKLGCNWHRKCSSEYGLPSQY